jgi:myb proto-oncogene protein
MSSIKQALLLQQNGEEVLRKGPWMPEEDEILVEYVRWFGARDWSSIQCKGLLPRTGKSCRLRWVNKLKPDLKSFFFFTFHSDL